MYPYKHYLQLYGVLVCTRTPYSTYHSVIHWYLSFRRGFIDSCLVSLALLDKEAHQAILKIHPLSTHTVTLKLYITLPCG